MAIHFEPLRIKSLKKETPDCVSICFEVPDEKKQAFAYKEGQNITVKKNIDGEELRRSYSICAAPHENELRIAVKKVEGGLFSGFANDKLKAGDTLEILPPTGNFNASLCGNKQSSYLAIAAGSGITPVISIIKHTLRTEPGSSFTLIFGNRSRSSIIFFDELQEIKNKFLGRFSLVNILSRETLRAGKIHPLCLL
jgi:ring-1,2-phenylacetyl-CoA epoxidase subunit PaaE